MADLENAEKCGYVVEVLKALAHPTRLKIVATLCEGAECVNAIAEKLGVNQAIISQQLRILRMGGLVEVTRDGSFSIYDLAEPRLRDLVACLERCCER